MMKVEIRNDQVHISGYVNVCSRDSKLLPSQRGTFIEQVEPKVFQRALERNDDVKLLFNHKSDRELGSQKQGNLTLYEDAIGLKAECVITDEEVISEARSGRLTGWSFGFIANEDSWDSSTTPQRRYLKDMDLLEVSVLSVVPAYSAMSLEARGEETVTVEQRFDQFEKVVKVEEVVEEVRHDYSEVENYITVKR